MIFRSDFFEPEVSFPVIDLASRAGDGIRARALSEAEGSDSSLGLMITMMRLKF